jgi:hypothetical protein
MVAVINDFLLISIDLSFFHLTTNENLRDMVAWQNSPLADIIRISLCINYGRWLREVVCVALKMMLIE